MLTWANTKALSDANNQHKNSGVQMDRILPGVAGHTFYNTSKWALASLDSSNEAEP